jgi:hypothetical protein
MIAITKGMIALSAALSAGFVTVYDFSVNRQEQPAVQVAQRFPAADEMFAPFTTKPGGNVAAAFALPKGDRALVAGCLNQDWPYIAQGCLVSSNGQPVRAVARVITIERRTGDNSSELIRAPLTTLANR